MLRNTSPQKKSSVAERRSISYYRHMNLRLGIILPEVVKLDMIRTRKGIPAGLLMFLVRSRTTYANELYPELQLLVGSRNNGSWPFMINIRLGYLNLLPSALRLLKKDTLILWYAFVRRLMLSIIVRLRFYCFNSARGKKGYVKDGGAISRLLFDVIATSEF